MGDFGGYGGGGYGNGGGGYGNGNGGGGYGNGNGGGGYGNGGGSYDSRPRENYARKEVGIDELWANNINSGINFSKYDNIKVKVDGENQPPPISKFTDAGLGALLSSNVKRAGYETPTPVQKNALPIIMAGRDLMA